MKLFEYTFKSIIESFGRVLCAFFEILVGKVCLLLILLIIIYDFTLLLHIQIKSLQNQIWIKLFDYTFKSIIENIGRVLCAFLELFVGKVCLLLILLIIIYDFTLLLHIQIKSLQNQIWIKLFEYTFKSIEESIGRVLCAFFEILVDKTYLLLIL